MSPNQILLLYIIFFVLEFLVLQGLSLLNARHARVKRNSIPRVFEKRIDGETFRRSIDYTLAHSKVGTVSHIFSSLVVLGIVLSGSLGWADSLLEGLPLPGLLHGIVFIFLVSLFFSLISLPFGIYQQFVVEERFGFNTTTPGLFIADTIKGLLISGIIFFPLLLGLFWFVNNTGKYWWLLGFLLFTVVQLLLSVLYPVLIAPLFNKFTPLEDDELKEKIQKLCRRLDFPIRGVFVMDGSKRSKHSNAYFTGFGRAKRIVLFDTLLEKFSHEEVLGVLSHEIGHAKKKHLIKGFVLSSALGLVGFFVIHLLMNYPPLYEAFGFTGPAPYRVFVILAFCAGPFTFFLQPAFTAWSRKREFEADRFAAIKAETGKGLINAFFTLARENLSNLVPHRWYAFFHYSHPTLGERIRRLKALLEDRI